MVELQRSNEEFRKIFEERERASEEGLIE